MTEAITGLSSMATRGILADLAALYGERTGRTVAIRSMGGVEAAARVRAGEAADLVVLAADVMERLEGEDLLVPGSRAPLAASGIAVAVRAGAPHPDLSDEAALRRATLAARRVCYSTGPSGTYLKGVWQGWGLDADASDRALLAPPGVPVGRLVAEGAADLGFQQLSELVGLPGIEVVGPLPPAVQLTTVFTGGILKNSTAVAAAREVLAFLVSLEADAIKVRHGMSPPS